MTSSGHRSDEDFLESLGISLDIDLTADADTHASVTGIYAQDPHIRLDVGETSAAKIPVEIFDHNNPVGVIISPSHLDHLRHFDVGRSSHKELLGALAERWWDTTNTFHFSWGDDCPSTDAWISWLIELGPNEMGIDQTVPIVDGTSVDSVITPGVTRAIFKAWVIDHHMVKPLPNPAGVHTSLEYRTWFIDAVWPIERPRRTALLSALDGWAQVD
ncbi:hypothetical protein JCGZ_25711 [Jatropha curcas]|uniref:Aminotransferase-like plant mobile domain-containing protein n=1 Tax=Jatropha curcas TaxID=180498 RepID=A0A067JXL4_JATCU|nr:hypothetical protein JCGZ_25711 [Jatropha curcas]